MQPPGAQNAEEAPGKRARGMDFCQPPLSTNQQPGSLSSLMGAKQGCAGTQEGGLRTDIQDTEARARAAKQLGGRPEGLAA